MTDFLSLGIPVIESSALKHGEIIYGADLAPNLDSMTIFAHPLAIIWLRYANESNEFIHRKSMEWLDQHLDRMVRDAEDRLDSMVAQMNAGTWGKKVVGVISEGPRAGSFVYQGDDGKLSSFTDDKFLFSHKFALPIISNAPLVKVTSG